MAGDRKLILVGVVASVIVGIGTIWYMILVSWYQASVDLYTAGRISEQQFAAQSRLLALGGLAPPILAGLALLGAILYWQRQRLGFARRRIRIAWRYLWPPMAVLTCCALPLLAVARGETLLTVVLSVVPPAFAVYLLRDRLTLSLATGTSALAGIPGRSTRASQHPPWTYDFIEHLSDESTMRREGRGSVVKKVRNAESDTVLAEAIFEHPSASDDTVIQFSVVGVAKHVRRLRIEGNYGILARFEDDDGQLKTSELPVRTGNKVRFEVRINQRSILQDERDDYGWIAIESAEPLMPDKGRLLVELRTNCLGDPSWNWAAWGELKLVEWKHHAT